MASIQGLSIRSTRAQATIDRTMQRLQERFPGLDVPEAPRPHRDARVANALRTEWIADVLTAVLTAMDAPPQPPDDVSLTAQGTLGPESTLVDDASTVHTEGGHPVGVPPMDGDSETGADDGDDGVPPEGTIDPEAETDLVPGGGDTDTANDPPAPKRRGRPRQS